MKTLPGFDPKNRLLAVLKGGPGSERDVSLRSGSSVAAALRSGGAQVEEIEVRNREVFVPEGVELVFNLIHGTFGEDGELQELLDRRGIRYTGEGAEGSRIAFDKILTKRVLADAGIATPRWEVLRAGDKPKLPLPFVVKAPRQGSSVGVHLVHSPEGIDPAVADCLRYGEEVLVEEMIRGRELTVGILGREALPVVEIRPLAGFYDFNNKYTKGATEYLVPAPLEEEESLMIRAMALAAHRALGLNVYGRVDVLYGPEGATVLEINTIPGMTETSLLPKAAACSGLDFSALCCRIAELSISARG
jgi:D-alanine-D-alanine ligase